MAIVNDLVTRFQYQGSLAPLDKYTSNLDGASKILGFMAAGMAAAVGGIAAMTLHVVDQADALGDLSARTGVAVEAIQKLDYAAVLNGSSVEAMHSSLEGLNRQIGMAANGEKMQGDLFKEMGISIKDAEGKVKSADVVFAEMQNTLSGKSPQEIAGYLRKLRLDPTLAETLGLTANEMATLNKEAEGFGIMSQEQINQAQAFNDSLDQLKMGMSGFTNQMMLSVAPSMLEGIEIFKSFLMANKELISGGLEKLVSGISGVIHVAKSLTQVYPLILGGLAIWGAMALKAAMATAKLNGTMLISPAVWIAAAFVGLILVVDDLVTAFNGGESVIATFFDKMFGIDIVNTMIKGFDYLGVAVSALLSPIFLVTDAFVNLFLAAAKGINFLGGDIDTSSLDKAARVVGELREANLKIALGQGATTPLKPSFSGSAVQHNQNNNITNNIHGSSDPHKTADLTSKAVQHQLQAAKVNGIRGGR